MRSPGEPRGMMSWRGPPLHGAHFAHMVADVVLDVAEDGVPHNSVEVGDVVEGDVLGVRRDNVDVSVDAQFLRGRVTECYADLDTIDALLVRL